MTESYRFKRVVYGNRTRVAGVRNRFPRPLKEHDVVRAAGIEPAISGVSSQRSAAELRAHQERVARIELAWNSLEDCRLASRPHPHRRTATMHDGSLSTSAGSRTSVIQLSRPVRTVSLAFRCERLLGKPSMHACSSRLRFGLRGSNSHFQSQNLAFCRLNEARSNCGSGEIRTLTSWIKSPVRCRYATDPKTWSWPCV
jgi:hypothetical protein